MRHFLSGFVNLVVCLVYFRRLADSYHHNLPLVDAQLDSYSVKLKEAGQLSLCPLPQRINAAQKDVPYVLWLIWKYHEFFRNRHLDWVEPSVKVLLGGVRMHT
jgi:hypothetical protein